MAVNYSKVFDGHFFCNNVLQHKSAAEIWFLMKGQLMPNLDFNFKNNKAIV